MNEVIFTGEDLLNIVIIAGILIGLSISLTTVNLWNACSKKKCAPRAFAISTLAIGYVLYLILLGLGFSLSGKDGTEAVLPFELHNTIDSVHMLSFALPCLVGISGLLLLLLCKPDSLPPLVAASAIAAVYLGNLMQVLYAVQITKQVDSPVFLLLYLYHFNLLLLSVQGIRKHLRAQVKIMQNQNTKLRHKWVQKLYHFLENVSHMRLFTFALTVPLVAILEIILILCGQGLDGVMKALLRQRTGRFPHRFLLHRWNTKVTISVLLPPADTLSLSVQNGWECAKVQQLWSIANLPLPTPLRSCYSKNCRGFINGYGCFMTDTAIRFQSTSQHRFGRI